MSSPSLVLATEAGAAAGGLAEAAALAVAAAADGDGGVLMAEVGADVRTRRPTLLAAEPARALEAAVRTARPAAHVAARGNLCWLTLAEEEHGGGAQRDPLAELESILAAPLPCRLAVVHLRPALWARALDRPGLVPVGGLIRADLRADRELVALAVAELHARGLRARVAKRSPGPVAARRSLAGLEAGGERSRRARRWAGALTAAPARDRQGEAARTTVRRLPAAAADAGQALPIMLGAVFAVLFATLLLAAIGGAVTGKGRAQRAADLSALSAARSMRDDFDRLLAPARLPDRAPNPAHIPKRVYLSRALAAAREAAARNGVEPARIQVRFPDADSFAPLRARVRVTGALERKAVPGEAPATQAVPVEARATAQAAAPGTADPGGAGGLPAMASGGGYSGPLAHRQGKPMRPDVAAAFDRMAAAARRSGLAVVITSAFRSDAEQAALFARNPDPRWVAPPGKSLHRCATELDLGPPAAYGWLAANAGRFGFLKRYSWEPWHLGFTRGPAPCSQAGNRAAGPGSRGGRSGDRAGGDGRAAGAGGLPAYVPARYRAAIERSAARWNVSAALLAAQLMAESNFNRLAPFVPPGERGVPAQPF